MKLYINSEELKLKIEELVGEVTNVFSNIRFEEFIVVCEINNMIMLRFIRRNKIIYKTFLF